MLTKLKNIAAIYPSLAAAQIDADKLAQPGDDWKYTPVELPNGKAKIAIYDEAGEFVDFWKM